MKNVGCEMCAMGSKQLLEYSFSQRLLEAKDEKLETKPPSV